MVELKPYRGEEERASFLIREFWRAHNQYEQTAEETKADLAAWTGEGHALYFILADGRIAGLLHLGSRGGEIDWLEDLFVLPDFQKRGIGSETVRLAEEIVKEYSQSMYIEAAARNEGAIRLYKKLGYSCLNTITVRKDFPGYEYDVIRKESLYGQEFEIRKTKE